MNPDTNREGTTISTLMLWEKIISGIITIVVLILVGFISFTVRDPVVVISVLFVIAIIAFLALFLVNTHIQQMIRERLNNLADVCRDYIGGDRSVRVVVTGDDEFGALSAAVNTLLDNQGNMAGVVVDGTSSDAAALQAQIEKLLQEVSAVGDGDLRVQAEVTPDTLGVLADSFNYMIEELAKVVGRVQSTAVQVTNATRRILDRSAELAVNSEAQVRQIAQTTEAVEALANFIQGVARNAQSSVEAAQDALKNAATGQLAVRQTIEGMMLIRENVQETAKKIKRLGERSNEIGEIVRIIEDIADQTNLLALNAAIQSAMAGEHGRGFAVVADEIRLLAERSTESTKRIATLVKSIQGDTYEAVVAMEDSTQEVVKGSQLADDAGRSLNSIYTAVERQTKMIEDIARAANEQTTVSEAVAIAMSRISEITRQTDAGTQEAAVSVSYLAELSEQLRASVSTFRLPDRANDIFGSLSNVASVNEFSETRGNQNYAMAPQPSQTRPGGSSTDFSWSGTGNSNFPPLPEPTNTGSLVPLNSHLSTSSLAGSGQQDFGRLSTFSASGGAQNISSSLGPNQGQASFSGFSSFSSFGSGFENQGQSPFAGQQNFGEMEDNQFNFPTNFSELSFGTSSGLGGGSQAQSLPNTGGANSGPQLFGQSSNARQRWQNVSQKDQNQ